MRKLILILAVIISTAISCTINEVDLHMGQKRITIKNYSTRKLLNNVYINCIHRKDVLQPGESFFAFVGKDQTRVVIEYTHLKSNNIGKSVYSQSFDISNTNIIRLTSSNLK